MGVPDEFQTILRRTHLFFGLEDADFREIMGRSSMSVLNAGQTLFAQQQTVTAFFWVAEGRMRLYRTSPQGDEKVIELLGPGRFFAEAAIFMGGHYPVNAAAQIDSRLIAIDGASYKSWLSQDANRCFRLLAGMSAKLHKMIEEIDRLTLMKGEDRLLQYLLDHSDPDESGLQVVELEAPKQVIASRIGVKPETFSRLLHKLIDMGCIRIQDNKLIIGDTEKIRQSRIE